MERFGKYYISQDWKKLHVVVSSGPARWSNPSYPNLKEYGINTWSLNENKTCGSMLECPYWTDLDFNNKNLIEMDKETFRLLYSRG